MSDVMPEGAGRRSKQRILARTRRNYIVFGGDDSIVSVTETPTKVEAFQRSMIHSAKTGKPMATKFDNIKALMMSKFDEQGVTPESMIGVVKGAMEATVPVRGSKEGETIPDHKTRLDATKLAFTAVGIIGNNGPQTSEPETIILTESDLVGKTPKQVISSMMSKVRASAAKGSPDDLENVFTDDDIEALGGFSKAAIGEMEEHDIDLGVRTREGSKVNKIAIEVEPPFNLTESVAEDVLGVAIE